MTLYKFLRGIVKYPCKLMYLLKVTGKKNEPVGQPYILCANHTSNNDVMILGTSLRSHLHFFAKESLFKLPVIGRLLKHIGTLPVDRSAQNGSFLAIKKSIALLKDGQVVGIFPQGTREPGVAPENIEPKSGIGMIVFHSKCRVLPVCIKTKGWHTRIFRRSRLIIGKPIEYDEFGFTNGRNGEFDRASRLIFDRIAELAKESA